MILCKNPNQMDMDALKLDPNEYGGVETRAKRLILSGKSSQTLKFRRKSRTVANSYTEETSRRQILEALNLIEFTLWNLLWELIQRSRRPGLLGERKSKPDAAHKPDADAWAGADPSWAPAIASFQRLLEAAAEVPKSCRGCQASGELS